MSRIQPLDGKSSAVYVQAFVEGTLYVDDGDSCCDVDVGAYGIGVIFPGEVEPCFDLRETARSILSQIVELDRYVASVDTSADDMQFHLSYVNIEVGKAELRYAGINVNSEWGALFVRDDDGAWQYAGLG